MRHRFALSLVAISLLLVGATVAQDAVPVAPPANPLLRALVGDAPAQTAPEPVRATEPLPPAADPLLLPAPPTPPTPDEPVPPAAGAWIRAQDGTDTVFLPGATTGNGFSFSDGTADARDYTTWYTYSSQVDLRVSVEGGHVTVHRNGQPVPDDQIERHGSTFHIHDGTGRLLVTIDVAEDGRVTIPARWSFRGPANWSTQSQSKNVIGIRTGRVEAALSQHLGLGDGEGILITEAVPGHPAATAGLRAHDVIVAIDGRRPATLELLKNTLQAKQAGDHISLTVVRSGNTLEIRSAITQISAPVGANSLPSGAYAVALGDYPGALTENGNVSAPTLLWRRSGNVAIGPGGGGFAVAPTPSGPGTVRSFGQSGGGAGGVVVAPDATGLPGGRVVSPGANIALGGRVLTPGGNQVTGAGVSPRTGRTDRLETIEKRLEKLEELLEKLLEQNSKSHDPRAELPRRAPKIDGVVVAVNDKLVILSVGSNDGVESGDEFIVYHGGQFVGQVEVSTVNEGLSGGSILFTQNNVGIEEGQSATTWLTDLTTGG